MTAAHGVVRASGACADVAVGFLVQFIRLLISSLVSVLSWSCVGVMVRAGVRVVLWWSGAGWWWRTAHTVVPDSCPCAVGADVFPCIAFGVRQAAGESRCCALLAAYTGGESRAVVCGGARARAHVCVCMCALSSCVAGRCCWLATRVSGGRVGFAVLRAFCVSSSVSPWLRGGRTDAGRRREARARDEFGGVRVRPGVAGLPGARARCACGPRCVGVYDTGRARTATAYGVLHAVVRQDCSFCPEP